MLPIAKRTVGQRAVWWFKPHHCTAAALGGGAGGHQCFLGGMRPDPGVRIGDAMSTPRNQSRGRDGSRILIVGAATADGDSAADGSRIATSQSLLCSPWLPGRPMASRWR